VRHVRSFGPIQAEVALTGGEGKTVIGSTPPRPGTPAGEIIGAAPLLPVAAQD
jgi:hypothetical protein